MPIGVLGHGEQIPRGKSICSHNHALILFHQDDGNLVLYYGSRPLWASNTNGRATTHLVLQTDGNLVLYNHGEAVWATNTNGAHRLVVQDDGNLVLYSNTDHAVWASNTCGKQPFPDVWKLDERVDKGEALVSQNGHYTFVHQHDGNVVVYDNNSSHAIWASNTAGRATTHLQFQGDGNLVLYHNGDVHWASNTNGKGANRAVMQNDGNFVLYHNDHAVWATK